MEELLSREIQNDLGVRTPKSLSMTPDAIRSRARREAKKSSREWAKKARKIARNPGKPKSKPRKPKAKTKPRKSKSKASSAERSERLDMRLTKAEKAKIIARAKKTRRTVTSLVIEAIEKIR